VPSQLEQTIRAAGLKVTNGRVSVLSALESAPHSDAESIFRRISDEVPGTSIQSVHNVLRDLNEAGLIRRIVPAGSAALYERRIGDNHHHAVCVSCGRVVDVECVVGEAPCLTPSDPSGFAVQSAEVTFWGTCSECQDERGISSGPSAEPRH
jgi:Fur family ferric uptake transcriptional regulator